MVEPVRHTARDLVTRPGRSNQPPPTTPGDALPDPNRRTVMCGLLIGLAAPGALAACSTSSDSSSNKPTPGGTTLAKLSEVPVGSGVIVNGPSGKVLLVRPSGDEVQGLGPVCPHAGRTVGLPQDGPITFPWH